MHTHASPPCDPATAVAPSWHVLQVLLLLAPATPLNVPAAHATHVPTLLAPEAVLYVPATQFVQSLTELDLFTIEYFPAGHGTHKPS